MCVTTHGAQPLKSAGVHTACEEPGMVWAGIGVRPSSAAFPKDKRAEDQAQNRSETNLCLCER